MKSLFYHNLFSNNGQPKQFSNITKYTDSNDI